VKQSDYYYYYYYYYYYEVGDYRERAASLPSIHSSNGSLE